VIHVRDKDEYPPIVDEGRVGASCGSVCIFNRAFNEFLYSAVAAAAATTSTAAAAARLRHACSFAHAYARRCVAICACVRVCMCVRVCALFLS
jgi:hypothetical protein